MTVLEKLKKGDTNTIELVTPSGYKVVIRQQTGEDDDIISDPSGSYLGEALNKFVQGIVEKSEMSNNKKPTYEDIENMKLCDKYFIVVASRIFSLGEILKFEYEWDDGLVAEYEEDLTKFIWDYSEDFPEKGDPDYFSFRIAPHKFGKDIVLGFKISTGKEFEFTFMNGHGEKYLMTLSTTELSKNAELKARELKQKIGEGYVKVENFKAFTAREMAMIRKAVFDSDPVIEILTEIPHPKTRDKTLFSLLASPDFLFPREI